MNTEWLMDVWNCQDKSPMFIIKYQAIKGGTNNQAAFVCFKEAVTEEMIQSKESKFIDLEQNGNPLL